MIGHLNVKIIPVAEYKDRNTGYFPGLILDFSGISDQSVSFEKSSDAHEYIRKNWRKVLLEFANTAILDEEESCTDRTELIKEALEKHDPDDGDDWAYKDICV